MDVERDLRRPNDGVVAYLIDPAGKTVASSSNITPDSTGTNAIGTNTVNVYKDNPQPGRVDARPRLAPQPVSGSGV